MKRPGFQIINICIAAVWFVNGFFCKILDLVPRHKEIVGQILAVDNADLITKFIGFLEVGMALWIISGYRFRLNAIIQIAVISIMNILEFIFVPELLLWGKWNSLFAALFIVLIYFNHFHLSKRY